MSKNQPGDLSPSRSRINGIMGGLLLVVCSIITFWCVQTLRSAFSQREINLQLKAADAKLGKDEWLVGWDRNLATFSVQEEKKGRVAYLSGSRPRLEVLLLAPNGREAIVPEHSPDFMVKVEGSISEDLNVSLGMGSQPEWIALDAGQMEYYILRKEDINIAPTFWAAWEARYVGEVTHWWLPKVKVGPIPMTVRVRDKAGNVLFVGKVNQYYLLPPKRIIQ